MHKKESGFILVLAMLICSFLIIIGTQLFYKTSSNSIFSSTMLKREKAKVLALSSIELAKSSFIFAPKKSEAETFEQGKQEPKKDDKLDYQKQIFENVYPYINRWQTYKFDDEYGEIKFCISCEDGKININDLYDFKDHKFKKNEYKDFFENIISLIQKNSNVRLNLKDVLDFLGKRDFGLNDPTEFLKLKDFESFKNNIFYNPNDPENLYLMDLFTIFSDSEKLQPIFLSNSLSKVLGLKVAQQKDGSKRAQIVPELSKKIKSSFSWSKDWKDLLESGYGKPFSSMPSQISKLFDTNFNPKTFSILAYANVSGVEQKVYAIVHFDKIQDKVVLTLQRLYWI